MERRRLGSSLDTVSAIGLGCAGMSGGYGTPDDSQSLRTLAVAAEHGIDFLDTSDAYGAGHNEGLLGRFLLGQRSRFLVGTKFGMVGKPSVAGTTIDNSPKYIHRACDASLRRLQIDTIDLYYAQRRDPSVPIEDMIGAMAELVKAGKVRRLGLCEVREDTLRRAHAVHPISAVQSEYSLWTRAPEREMLDITLELGVTFVAFCPLGRAFLAGTVKDVNALETYDFRRFLPRFRKDAIAANITLVHRLEVFAARHGATSAQLALSWLLAKYPHVVPIPGTKRPHYAIENASAVNIKLTQQEVRDLDQLFLPSDIVGERYPAAAMVGIETIG